MNAQQKSIRLLLVDDHIGFSQAVARHLRKYEWIDVVGNALDGREALTMVAGLAPDAVLMDMTMPQMDGPEATRRIKAAYPLTYVVLTSHYDDTQHREKAANAGADAFVSKMMFLEEIDACLQSMSLLLNSRRNSK